MRRAAIAQNVDTQVPIKIAGHLPKKINEDYGEVIPAKNALTRSLNISASPLLQQFGHEKSADIYGPTLILGATESNP